MKKRVGLFPAFGLMVAVCAFLGGGANAAPQHEEHAAPHGEVGGGHIPAHGPAPAPRSEGRAPAGTWFIGNRPTE